MVSDRGVTIRPCVVPSATDIDSMSKSTLLSENRIEDPSGETAGVSSEPIPCVICCQRSVCVSARTRCVEPDAIDAARTMCRLSGIQEILGVPADRGKLPMICRGNPEPGGHGSSQYSSTSESPARIKSNCLPSGEKLSWGVLKTLCEETRESG